MSSDDPVQALMDTLRKLRDHGKALEAENATLQQRLTDSEAATNGAYRERAMLVALLASLWPSTLSPGQGEGEWPVIHIDGPAGQMGWHISPDDVDLFEHVERGSNQWDGHDTPEKFRRIREATINMRDYGKLEAERDDLRAKLATAEKTLRGIVTGDDIFMTDKAYADYCAETARTALAAIEEEQV